jgi:hypothetical protein
MTDAEINIRAAVNLLRDAAESRRYPSGEAMSPEMVELHERAAAWLEILRAGTLPTHGDRLVAALLQLNERMPSTKGMGPKDRANRLHSELERRIAIARDALYPRLKLSEAAGRVSDG